jgi:uncharacterized protein YegL
MNTRNKQPEAGKEEMSKLKAFTVNKPHPLPVILLADISGSMAAEAKIAALNRSISDMISSFANEEEGRAEIQVSIITFGEIAEVHTALKPAEQIEWADMRAGGRTPMGAAMELAANLIENREAIPARAYRPTVVLVSDGIPTDDWEKGFRRLTGEGRGSKAFRLSLAIGGDADEAMLREFAGGAEAKLYRAEDARRIRQFFEFLTMTVTHRSRSINPNAVPQVSSPFDLEF